MSAPTTSIKLNSTTPAPPSGEQNVVFQSDGGTPLQQITASDPPMVGDTGSGGVGGNVPAPPAGAASAGKFLKADGTWSVPTGSGDEIQVGNGSPLPVPPSLVQGAVNGNFFGATVAFPSDVTAGNVLVVLVSTNSGSPTVSDSLGTSYTAVLTTTTPAPAFVFVGRASASGPNTVTVGGSIQYPEVGIAEITGITTTLDASNVVFVGATTGSITLTTTSSNDVVLLLANNDNNGTFTATGCTIVTQNNDFDAGMLCVDLPATTGVQTYGWGIGNTSKTTVIAVALTGSTSGVSGAQDDVYFDRTTTPYTGYVYDNGGWTKFGESGGGGTSTVHSEPLTDGQGNFIFAGGDIIVVLGVPD